MHRRFGGTYYLHLQENRMNFTLLVSYVLLVAFLTYPYSLKMEQIQFTKLYDVKFQKVTSCQKLLSKDLPFRSLDEKMRSVSALTR
jgi:hypothetical protein